MIRAGFAFVGRPRFRFMPMGMFLVSTGVVTYFNLLSSPMKCLQM